MESLPVDLSSLRPNEDEMDQKATDTTYSSLSSHCHPRKIVTEQKLEGCEDTGSRTTGVDRCGYIEI